MNLLPVAERELRVAARHPGVYWLRFFIALAMVTVWLTAVSISSPRMATYAMNRVVFGWMVSVTFACGMFAGVFLTADCLSREKREGTLGLLFLTDLHGYDIVFGKLAAKAIHALYGMLAITPILALPLLVGGISGKAFTAAVIALLNSLFFAMAIGMLVSVYARDIRAAMIAALTVLLSITLLLPGIRIAIGILTRQMRENDLPSMLLVWPSPLCSFAKALDAPQSMEFVCSTLLVGTLGVIALLAACMKLPRLGFETGESAQPNKTANRWWRRQRFGDGTWRTFWRKKHLDAHPFFWLATRDRFAGRAALLLLQGALPLWLAVWLMTLNVKRDREVFFLMCFAGLCALHLLVKVMIAMEASQRLCEDRHNGGFELLLSTPLQPARIVDGQWKALKRLFTGPILFMLVYDLALLATLTVFPDRINMGSDNRIFIKLVVGLALGQLVDFWALSWTGMRQGTLAKQHFQAATIILGKVLGPSWVATLFFFLLSITGSFRSSAAEELIDTWLVCGVLWSLVLGQWMRERLGRNVALK